MKITRFLAFRLFLVILIVVLVGMGIFTTLTVRRIQERTTESLIVAAARISDIIKRSTHYSMLLNRREDIYQSITTIGNEPGIHAIRIYNKKGEITFSTEAPDVGKVVDRNAEACTACHSNLHLGGREPSPGHHHPDSQRSDLHELRVPRARSQPNRSWCP
jgi:sensor histidine kinase regulating citrate/malate metabolism